jgi:hypothetical protein
MFRFLLMILGLIFIAVLVGGTLAFTGEPAACVNRTVTPSTDASAALRAAWADFGRRAAANRDSLEVTEEQATSRAVQYLDEHDVPVEGLQIYFCPDGHAEAVGEIDVAGLKSKVVVEGTLDLSGSDPTIQIDEIRAGNLPNSVAKPAVDFLMDRGDFRTLRLRENLIVLVFTDGVATVTAEP